MNVEMCRLFAVSNGRKGEATGDSAAVLRLSWRHGLTSLLVPLVLLLPQVIINPNSSRYMGETR